MEVKNLLKRVIGGGLPEKPKEFSLNDLYLKNFAIVVGPMSEEKRQILFATLGALALKNRPIKLDTITRYPDTSGHIVYVDFMTENIYPKEIFKLIGKKAMVWNVEEMEDLLIFKSNLTYIIQKSVIYR